jgi:proteic killer suppression protein
VARRKLEQLNQSGELGDLRIPPGNRLEALKGNRAGQHSIQVNDQFRVCFRWAGTDVEDVEIVDYH